MSRNQISESERVRQKNKRKNLRSTKKKIEMVTTLHSKLATEKDPASLMRESSRQINCTWCEKRIPENRYKRRAKYCSNKCRHEKEGEQYRKANPSPYRLATATTGAISEYRVVVDCLSRGFEVFRACSPACSCDLAILHNNQLKRIEVKTAYRTPSGKLYSSNANIRADIFARVLPDEVIYEPPLPKIK